jgi:regulation of enolase protein 1 (concanavalin A-like superfamily)
MFEAMQWLNEPASWSIDGERITVTPQAESDFWRNTFYGFVHDNGHFFHREVRGGFTAEVTLVGGYENMYDQSGLMVRSDERRWIKAGLELTDGAVHMSTVLTRDHSDWAVLALPAFEGKVRLRLTRHGDAIRVEFALPGDDWQLQRLGYLPLPETCSVGLMCCAPVQAGFEAAFEEFAVSEPISRDLHG